MDFYEDVVRSTALQDLPVTPPGASGAPGAHFHTWTPETIARLWSIWTSTPILRSQFYPAHYYEALLNEAAPYLGDASVIADIGCGAGTMLSLLRERHAARQVIGVDVSDASIVSLKRMFANDGAFQFKVGSITRTGLDAASCDVVICTETLEHLFPADFAAGLAEIARVLKPGGRLLGSVPLEERPNFVVCPECQAIFTPYQHMLFNFTIAGLRDALAANDLEIVHVIHPIDLGVPRRAWKRVLKERVLRRFFPGLSRRLFRAAGVSGFVARKAA
jgi:SAM-dependent methyltransferase